MHGAGCYAQPITSERSCSAPLPTP